MAINWRLVTRAEYLGGTPVENDLYYLSDTHEVYRGSESYSQAVELFNSTSAGLDINGMPATPADHRLYIDTDKSIGYTYDVVNGEWVTLFGAPTAASFTDVAYDENEKTLDFTMSDGSASKTITLSGLGSDLSLVTDADNKQLKIQLKDVSGNLIGSEIALDMERFVTGAEYDAEGKAVILYFDGKTGEASTDKIRIPMGDLAPTPNKVFQGPDIATAVGGETPHDGDVCIIKGEEIGAGSGKFEYTAYIYTNADWAPMDGSYNAENVYFDADLMTTKEIGNITLTDGSAIIPAAGKNLKEVWNTIFVKEANPTATQPAVTLTTPQNRAYEVGTNVTPSFNATLSAGSYTYGPATGIVATSWSISDTDGNTATTSSGSFTERQVVTGDNYRITASATHAAGAVPVTNLGNPYAAAQITEGTKTRQSAAITGFRCGFYGTVEDKSLAVDSALIRSLANKTTAAPAAGNTWNLAIPVGASRVVIAYPATIRDVSSILDVNGLNAEIKSSFTVQTVAVEGANSYTAIDYKVYTLDYANPNDTANTYRITL